jgi:hypothetical protein
MRTERGGPRPASLTAFSRFGYEAVVQVSDTFVIVRAASRAIVRSRAISD